MRFIQSSFLMVLLLSASFTSANSNDANVNVCSVSTEKSGTLGQARSLFKSACATHILKDCDPIKGGGWQCSSGIIGTAAPGGTNTNSAAQQTATISSSSAPPPPPEPAEIVVSVPEPTPAPVVQTSDSGECYVVATGLGQSKIAFAQKCAAFKRNDCDPLGNNRWVCSSANVSNTQRFTDTSNDTLPTATNSQSASSVENNNTDSVTPAPVSAIVEPEPQAQPQPQVQVEETTQINTQVGRLGSNDLLVLHYDNCPDKDDGHAIPAGKSVVEKYDINNILVVNGTCGNSIRNRFNSASNAVMKASWGTQYLDADAQRASAVQQAATRWASTLSNGANVWVAEGGQSDFTADVVRKIEANYSNISLKRIHVIQHSAGRTAYNEQYTDAANLSYLKNKTSYQPIANGNVGGNGTADLNQQSFYFVISARASRFSAEWNAGFEYLQPDCSVRTENCKLDFSDTVELLYIIDDQRTQNVNDFANHYLN